MRFSFKPLGDLISSLFHFITEDIWKLDFRKLSPIRAFFLKQIRIGLIVVRKFSFDRLSVRASALVYATLLSIVPLLAVMFSLLKGFGYHNELQPVLEEILKPLGQQAVDTIVPTMVGFVENASVAALGAVGFLIFLLSSISIVNHMERSFNDIWQIEKTRSLKRKFGDYLGVLIMGPVLAITVLAITASLQNHALIRTISENPVIQVLANWATPYITSWIVFTFLLMFIPNTRVRFPSALYGALIAGTLWQLMNLFFTRFIVYSYQSGTKAALYASFAVIPLFLVWLFFSWTVVLLGAAITFVHQNLNRSTGDILTRPLSWHMQETIALKIMVFISQRFCRNEKAPSQSELAAYLRIPQPNVNSILTVLMDLELVNIIGRGVPGYAPAGCLETMSLQDIVQKLRSYGGTEQRDESDDAVSRLVAEIQHRFDRPLKDARKDSTLRELVAEIDKGYEKS